MNKTVTIIGGSDGPTSVFIAGKVGSNIAFLIWMIIGLVIIGLGVHTVFSKKAIGFWANMKAPEVSDVRKYNHAAGKLLIIYGGIFVLLGIPLLMGQNSPFIILSVLGVFFETIIIMAVFILAIENKYKK